MRWMWLRPRLRKGFTMPHSVDSGWIVDHPKQEARCDHPEEHTRRIFASGTNGRRYPVKLCTKCGNLSFDHTHAVPFAKSFHRSQAPSRREIARLEKALPQGCYKDPASCGLRWITLHPNGDDTTGVPVLVHDNGEQYTVVGGAGGSMNQTVFQKPKGADAEERKARKAEKQKAREEKRKAHAAEETPDEAAAREKAALIRAEAKQQTEELHRRILEHLGSPEGLQGDVLKMVEVEAERRALAQKPDATPEEQAEFVDSAKKAAVVEAQEAAKQALNQVLDKAALRQLGDDDQSPVEIAATISGKRLVRQMSEEDLNGFVQQAAQIAALKGQARAIQRALRVQDPETLAGLEAAVKPLSPEEAKAQNLERYLRERDVDLNTGLVVATEQASPQTQVRFQTLGTVDGLNSFVASLTGNALLRPESARLLGTENAARVASEHLRALGANAPEIALQLRQRIAEQGLTSVAAVMGQVAEMDAIVARTKEAAASGDGVVTGNQAAIVAANMASEKYRLLNVARGQLRAVAALAWHLENPTDKDMVFPGGDTLIAAHATAQRLGLGEGYYAVEKTARGEGGGYQVRVMAQNVARLGTPHSLSESERNVAMDALREAVERNPGEWRADGFNYSRFNLQPHHELAVRAIVDQKRMVLNYGAGSGKTSIYHAALAHLIHSGAVEKAIVTMPAKPRAQQATGVDPETGTSREGEIDKFVPGMSGVYAVVRDGADLRRQLEAVARGEKKVLVMSPHMMRDHLAELQEAGFGGEKTAFFADEAHEFAIGVKEGRGSEMARAAREMARSEYFVAGSGTLIENDASELWSLYDLAHPGSLGSQKQFTSEWQRLARGQKNFFASESFAGMRDRLSGGMLSYHRPVTGATGEPLELSRHTVTVEVTPEQRAAIARANEQYKKEKRHEDPGISKAAALRRRSRVMRILTQGVKDAKGAVVNPKLEVVRAIAAAERGEEVDPKFLHEPAIQAAMREARPENRVGVYAFEKAPLRLAMGAIGGRTVSITGDDDDRATRDAVAAINDRASDVRGVGLSNAANYGVNLQGMDHLIKFHALDVPSKEDQLDHRHFRTGQTRNVRATTILANHPDEQLTQYRTHQVKGPEIALLSSLADDSQRAPILGAHYEELREAAGLKTGGGV